MADVSVIGIGCEIDRLFASQPAALPVPDGYGPDQRWELWDLIASPLRGGDEAVIVIVGGWLSDEVLRSVRTVRSLLDSHRVVVHVTPLPPLAASVATALIAALAPRAASAGTLAGAIEPVEDLLYVLASSASVARLPHPEVSMLQHVRSLVPGTAFGIGLAPEQFVVALNDPSVPLEPPEHKLELLAAVAGDRDLGWFTDVVSPALGGAGVRVIEPTIHGAKWWGSSRLVEAVGVPVSLDWLEHAVLRWRTQRCQWCGQQIFEPPCPICGHGEQNVNDRQANAS